VIETVTVVGILPADADDTPGSVVDIESEELERMNPLTAKEALRRAPGLAVIDEDILGLKLNVSVRGLNARRSGRSLLMEDGAPIQLGPYSDPSAHYYPPMPLVEGIEMRRGSGQIPYGPQSIGGTINFVTRPAPTSTMADATVSGGEDGYRLLHLGGGLGGARGGVRADLLHSESEGIREGHSSRVDEISVRGRWRASASHALGAKASYYEEDTRLTESGLTQARYDISPYYNPFDHDRFDLARHAFQFVHDWRAGASVTLSSQLYHADTSRASYRQTDSSIDPMTPNPETGCTGAARTDYEAFAARCGNKMRPRRYDFTGAETRLQAGHTLFGARADLGAGLRLHAEDGRR
jgi:Fe(3+) dicitrate transport protein